MINLQSNLSSVHAADRAGIAIPLSQEQSLPDLDARGKSGHGRRTLKLIAQRLFSILFRRRCFDLWQGDAIAL
jgi:hypothetical protein